MTTINSILIEPGKKPIIYKLSANINKQMEEMSAILGGNFASARLFQVGNGISLHIFVNDMAIPLRLPANRILPDGGNGEIIFGKALFLALEDEAGEEAAALDIPEDICSIFIEKLEENLPYCTGDEIPTAEAEIFTEHAGTKEERRFKWEEVTAPVGKIKFIGNGYVRFVDDGNYDTVEINGRYFKQKYLFEDSKQH